jgi:hypothetical protein
LITLVGLIWPVGDEPKGTARRRRAVLSLCITESEVRA